MLPRSWTTPLIVAATALLGACAAGPDYRRPALPSAADYAPAPPRQVPDAAAPAPTGGTPTLHRGTDVPFDWWRAYGDPALDSLVERVLHANPTVPAARAALHEAQELASAQRGSYLPQIGANYQFQRQKLAGNLSGSSAPGVQGNGDAITATQNPAPAPAPHNEPLYYNFHTAQLTVGFVPDAFGANRRQVESLDAQARLQRLELEATYVTLASNVVAAAITEASLRAQLDATRALVTDQQRTLEVLRRKLRSGYAMQADVAAQEVQLAQARSLLMPLEKQFEQNRDLIRALAGNPPDRDVPERFALAELHLPRELPLSLPSRIVEERPDVLAAEQQLRAANAAVGVAVAAMLPQFTIDGGYGGTATGFGDMFRSGGPFWSLVGGVTQPLFEGGALLHRKRAADQALRQAAALYQLAVLTAWQNVADVLHALSADADALGAAADAEHAARTGLDLIRARERSGFVDQTAALAADSGLQQAALARTQAEAARLADTAALYQALGGGWWNRRDEDSACYSCQQTATRRP